MMATLAFNELSMRDSNTDPSETPLIDSSHELEDVLT